jgi:hypothetical protein
MLNENGLLINKGGRLDIQKIFSCLPVQGWQADADRGRGLGLSLADELSKF